MQNRGQWSIDITLFPCTCYLKKNKKITHVIEKKLVRILKRLFGLFRSSELYRVFVKKVLSLNLLFLYKDNLLFVQIRNKRFLLPVYDPG